MTVPSEPDGRPRGHPRRCACGKRDVTWSDRVSRVGAMVEQHALAACMVWEASR